jgi:hypothetical protein
MGCTGSQLAQASDAEAAAAPNVPVALTVDGNADLVVPFDAEVLNRLQRSSASPVFQVEYSR